MMHYYYLIMLNLAFSESSSILTTIMSFKNKAYMPTSKPKSDFFFNITTTVESNGTTFILNQKCLHFIIVTALNGNILDISTPDKHEIDYQESLCLHTKVYGGHLRFLWESNLATAQTYIYRRTAFENLGFWSGDSGKSGRRKELSEHKNCRKSGRYGHIDKRYDNRRRYTVFDSRSNEEKLKSTRFAVVDLEHTSHMPEASSNEKMIRNTKINGYALLPEMTSIMELLNVNASVSVIAKTVEVHDIVLCKIAKTRKRQTIFRTQDDKYVDEKPKKKIILIVHGLSTMGFRDVPCLYKKESFMRLVKMYTQHLDRFEIFLIPMGNPDGIADETLEMWNKNKSPQPECSGVALDRNFDVKWNNTNGYHSCSQQYPGPVPFSESESRAVADLIHYYSDRIVAYIHVHGGTYNQRSFKGDAVLYPKGYEDEPIDDEYNEIQTGLEEAMRNAGFKVYALTVTSLHNWYGKVSGTSVDYATTVYGIPFGLEFVMQSYADYETTRTTSEEMQDNILQEVWKRVIDVVFDVVFKSTEPVKDN